MSKRLPGLWHSGILLLLWHGLLQRATGAEREDQCHAMHVSCDLSCISKGVIRPAHYEHKTTGVARRRCDLPEARFWPTSGLPVCRQYIQKQLLA
jgi:hypothetical protein